MNVPFLLANPDYDLFRKLIKFIVARKERGLIVCFPIPLIQDESLNIYRLYPIPEITNKVGTFMNLEIEIILVNDEFSRFIGFKRAELEQSCTSHNKKWYCKDFNLLSDNQSSCEMAIMKEKFTTLKSK